MSAASAAGQQPVIAVCGKGGVGKTALSALLARALRDAGVAPILLVDADPVGGLTLAIGEGAARTIGDVRAHLISAARHADDAERQRLADDVDYLVLEALIERDDYALLAMGRKVEKGCFCPVNKLMREAIDLVATPFSAVLIDAEAGIEQVNRQVTRRTTRAVVVVDGSQRATQTYALLRELLGAERVVVVANRVALAEAGVPADAPLVGAIPEDDELRRFDRLGRSLWELPADNPAVVAARDVAAVLGLLGAPAAPGRVAAPAAS